MTMTLAHPAAEDLGRFVEGILDDAARAAVVAHIADCDECRIVVVDATAFSEESVTAARGMGGLGWLAAAASIAIVAGGVFSWYSLRNPLAPMMETYAHLRSRPVQARLSGFPYIKVSRMRGGGESDSERDLTEVRLEGDAASVLERRGEDPKTLHAKGIAFLVTASVLTGKDVAAEIIDDRNKAIENLQVAAVKAPRNTKYLSDLASALIETRTPANLERAVEVCDHALQIDPRSTDALFNRAIALDLLNRTPEAIAAFRGYLAVDSSSPWATEVRETLQNPR